MEAMICIDKGGNPRGADGHNTLSQCPSEL